MAEKDSKDKSKEKGQPLRGRSKYKELLKEYEVGQKLGSGNFAVVRLVRRRKDKKYFAAKIINKNNLKEDELKTIFDEVEIIRKLSHPNINEFYDIVDCKNYLVLVLGLLAGGELFEIIIKKKRFTEPEAAEVIRQVARACGYMHERGIVHRDLKPENLVYMDKDRTQICVTDFGLGKSTGMENGLMKTACGTPGYVAPEVLKQKPYTSQVDMWSLGVILYILLCGFPPFKHKKIRELYKLIKAGNYTFPSPYWDGVSDQAKDVVNKLLTVDPAKRITAKQLEKHPWVAGEIRELTKSKSWDAKRNLISNGYDKRFRKYIMRRKLKRGVNMILSINRMLHIAFLNDALDAEELENAKPKKTELDVALEEDAKKTEAASKKAVKFDS